MQMKLRDVAAIQVGYTFRAPPSSLEPGDVAVIQVRDLTPANKVAIGGLAKVQIEAPKENHLVRREDLVFRSRGNKFTSAIVADEPGVAIVAGPLFRIRVSTPHLLPSYLNWYLCQSSTQNVLSGLAKGTLQQMISKEALEDIEIAVPPLERQRAIMALSFLGEEEQALMEQISELRKKMISSHLIQWAKGA